MRDLIAGDGQIVQHVGENMFIDRLVGSLNWPPAICETLYEHLIDLSNDLGEPLLLDAPAISQYFDVATEEELEKHWGKDADEIREDAIDVVKVRGETFYLFHSR